MCRTALWVPNIDFCMCRNAYRVYDIDFCTCRNRHFRELEKHVKLDRLHPFVNLSCNAVHGGSKGFYRLGLNEDLQDKLLRLTTLYREVGGVPEYWEQINWHMKLINNLNKTITIIDTFIETNKK